APEARTPMPVPGRSRLAVPARQITRLAWFVGDDGLTIHRNFAALNPRKRKPFCGSSPTVARRSTDARTAVVYRSGMKTAQPPPDRLAEMPLWRLLVLLADIEREIGAASPTARVLTRLINERLRSTPAVAAGGPRKGVPRA